MVDLPRLRAGALPEEEDVARLELRRPDAVAPRHLAAHLHRRAAAERVGEVALPGIRGELVDLPDEARAVEPGAAAGARPDVGVADVRDGRGEDARLPGGEAGQREGAGRGPGRGELRRRSQVDGADRGGRLPTVASCLRLVGGGRSRRRRCEAEDPRDRVGGVGARRGPVRERLEAVLVGGQIRPQPEEPRDGLRAEALGRGEPGRGCDRRQLRGAVAEPEGVDEQLVEALDRDDGGRIGDGPAGSPSWASTVPSASAVNGSCGRKSAASVAKRPRWVTIRICACAQERAAAAGAAPAPPASAGKALARQAVVSASAMTASRCAPGRYRRRAARR